MRKIGMEEILNALCEELNLTPNNTREIAYPSFRWAMLSADLFTTDTTIKTRWAQLLTYNDYLLHIGRRFDGEIVISLDFANVYEFIKSKGKEPVFSLTQRERQRESASEGSQ